MLNDKEKSHFIRRLNTDPTTKPKELLDIYNEKRKSQNEEEVGAQDLLDHLKESAEEIKGNFKETVYQFTLAVKAAEKKKQSKDQFDAIHPSPSDYRVVSAGSDSELSEKVCLALRSGWVPIGGVAIRYLGAGGSLTPGSRQFCQAMIKYEV